MTSQSKPRYEFIDLMKGICISLVILYHCAVPYFWNSEILTTFRMPLYFILSGIFFKSYDSFKEFSFKKINSLIVPFLATWILYNISNNLNRYISGEELEVIICPRSLWFLFCLFEVGLLYYLIKLVNHTMLETIICFSLSIIGYLLFAYNIKLPLFLDTCLTSTIFYHYGSLLKSKNILKEQKKTTNFLLLALSVATFIIVGNIVDLEKLNLRFNRYPSTYIVSQVLAISGTMSVLYLSKIINKLPLISHYGKYSIILLCANDIYLGFLKAILDPLGMPRYVMFVIFMILMIPTIYLVNKYIPFLFAQKSFFTTLKTSRLYITISRKAA